MVKRSLVILGLMACVASFALSAEPSTTINGTLTNPFGSTSGAGTVSCALSAAGTWDDGGTPTPVTTPVTGTIASDGTVALVLTPNDAITPSDTYWVCDWVESGVTRWRDQPLVPSDPDPIAVGDVPRMELPPPEGISVYAPFINRAATYYNQIQFDANGDTLWDIELTDDGTNSGIVLRNGYGFIQYGVGAKLKLKLCTSVAYFFWDEDDDGTDDGADDYCWGPGIDANCDCVVDTGAGSGDMAKSVYDTDNDGTVDMAEAVVGGSSPAGFALVGASDWYTFSADEDGTADMALFDPRTVDSDGNGTADLNITAGGLAGVHGDGANTQRLAIFPGGYSSDPFDYTSGFVFENTAAGQGALYPIMSDPNYATLVGNPQADLGTSTKKWRNVYASWYGYFSTFYMGVGGVGNSSDSVSYYATNGGQQNYVDYDADDSAQRYYSWSVRTDDNSDGTSETRELMHLDRDATPHGWVDVNGDGSYDIQFDSTMTDCDTAATSKVLWDISTGKLSCGTDRDTGDELTVDGTATATPNLDDGGDINFAYAAPNITGTVKADSVALTTDTTGNYAAGDAEAGNATGVACTDCVALGSETTGNYAGSSSEGGAATTATALAANGSNCSAGQYTLGVDASGAAESCTTFPVLTLTFTGATAVCNADPPLFKAPYAMTITGISCAVFAATSIPLSVEECDSSLGSCAGTDGATTITCSTTGASDDGSLSNPSIDSGDWIKLNFGSASGTIVGATVTIKYTTP